MRVKFSFAARWRATKRGLVDRFLEFRRAFHAFGFDRNIAFDHIRDGGEECCNAFACAGSDGNGGYTQVTCKTACIHFETFAAGFIHQVDRHDDLVCDLHDLHDQIQITFERGCISHYDGAIRLPE